jgi:hypothetical protein
MTHQKENSAPRALARKSLLSTFIAGILLSAPLYASTCINGVDSLSGLACVGEGDNETPVFAPDSVAFTEVRGKSAIAVIVLHDETLIAMDLVGGFVAITQPGAQPKVTSVNTLDASSQQQFQQLASLLASNPDFDMEVSLGQPAYIPGRSYPLSLADLGLPTVARAKDFNERSPCPNNRCRRVEVRAFNPTFGSILVSPPGLDAPPLPQPIVPTCGPGVPQAVCDDKWRTDRQSWERWREGRCDDAALNGAAFAAAGAATWISCVSPAVVLVGPCVVSVIGYVITAVTTGLAARDCASTYRGPGTWP